MEIFIVSFVPRCCPSCGVGLRFDRMSTQDFLAGAPCTCVECGAHFRYVKEEKLQKIMEA